MTTITKNFLIIKRYNHITLDRYWEHCNEVKAWCMDPNNGKFHVQDNNVFYIEEQDLAMFLLRWG